MLGLACPISAPPGAPCIHVGDAYRFCTWATITPSRVKFDISQYIEQKQCKVLAVEEAYGRGGHDVNDHQAREAHGINCDPSPRKRCGDRLWSA